VEIPVKAAPVVCRWDLVEHRRSIATALVAGGLILSGMAPLHASAATLGRKTVHVPDWAKDAVAYALTNGYVDRSGLEINKPMPRATFKAIMKKAFGGGFSRDKGDVTAFEVGKSLVKALGQKDVALHLTNVKTPDGWSHGAGKDFGYEVVARSLGLRHDRSTSEEHLEASSDDPLNQGDVLWAVWQAKTSPDTYTAGNLANFSLTKLGKDEKEIVKFAFSLAGTPYVWGGEWIQKTPDGYPYGAQPHGGVDCSGFTWYVMREKASGWSPKRPYKGFALPERSSAQMASATPKKKRLGFKELKPTDLVFFASGGRGADPASVYHVGIYLGNGWMIDSSGSKDGVSLSYMGQGSWYLGQFVFGRRIV
jgi:cell wall-associated NlpC family hydrolase